MESKTKKMIPANIPIENKLSEKFPNTSRTINMLFRFSGKIRFSTNVQIWGCMRMVTHTTLFFARGVRTQIKSDYDTSK